MKQLVVEKNNPTPILWDTPIPNPGPGEILIKNHYSVVSSGTELAAIEVANTSVTDKLQNSSILEIKLSLMEATLNMLLLVKIYVVELMKIQTSKKQLSLF